MGKESEPVLQGNPNQGSDHLQGSYNNHVHGRDWVGDAWVKKAWEQGVGVLKTRADVDVV